jgi:glycosyltransferase involved in cell wall biosynthesis
MAAPDILLDVSRLVWRLWRGGLATGIDRVALAYVEHFQSRARAVVQRRGRFLVLSKAHSDLLFGLILAGPQGFRQKFVRLAFRSFPAANFAIPPEGSFYLNIGHTGLDEPTLPAWISRHRLRAIFLIHDLIPLSHPEYCRPGEAEKHQRRMENALNSAFGVIANSRATMDELRSFANLNKLRMPPGVVAWIAGKFFPQSVAPTVLDRPYFIVLGTIEGRKNHHLLLNIWKALVATHGDAAPILVIVGQRGWEANEAIEMLDAAADLRSHVIELGSCGDAELAGFIAGARALLMPSFTEGFGLPVAEALALGTPVIASDLDVFREFAGDIPTYLEPLDANSWLAMIDEFSSDSVERSRQLATMSTFRAFDWEAHFEVVDEWLKNIPQKTGALRSLIL